MVKIHIDYEQQYEKPTPQKTKFISTRICKTVQDVTPGQLANEITKGKTIVLGVMKDEQRKKANLNHQEVIALDFDDGTPIEQIQNDKFIQDNASFIYKTFSNTDEHNRFRVVFILDEMLTTNEQIEAVYNKLFEIYPMVDFSCKDSSRLFFGGNEFIEIDFNNKLNAYELVGFLPLGKEIIEREESAPLTVVNTKSIDLNDRPTWWLIRHNHDDIVKARLSKYKASVEHQATAMNHIKSLNMREVLGFAPKGNIHDLFSPDNNPSVDVYEYEKIWLYTRHSSDKDKHFTGNIIQVVQKLKKTHFIGALNYLIDVMNIDFNVSDTIKNLNNEIEIYTSLLLSKDLEKTYPSIHKIFKDGRTNYSSDVVQILQILKTNVIEVDNEIRMISQLSTRELSVMIHGSEKKKDRIARVLNLMTTTDWIVKINTDDLPQEIRDKMIAFQKQKNRKYHKNVIEFIALGTDFFSELVERCDSLVDGGFTSKGTLTKEGLQYTLGKDEADKVFTQDTKRKISSITHEIETEAVQYIMNQIDRFGYVEEKAILNHLSQFTGKSFSDLKMKQLRKHLIDGYGLERCRLNKALKKEFGVSDKYTQTQAPTIFKLL